MLHCQVAVRTPQKIDGVSYIRARQNLILPVRHRFAASDQSCKNEISGFLVHSCCCCSFLLHECGVHPKCTQVGGGCQDGVCRRSQVFSSSSAGCKCELPAPPAFPASEFIDPCSQGQTVQPLTYPLPWMWQLLPLSSLVLKKPKRST